jgi:hypothetical protein
MKTIAHLAASPATQRDGLVTETVSISMYMDAAPRRLKVATDTPSAVSIHNGQKSCGNHQY